MSACNQQVFNGVTQDRWNCIKNAIQSKTGVVITTDSGTAAQSGVSIQWNFDSTAQVLSIQCMEKPFIVPCALIESKITDVVTGCLNI
jgi:hypothetical protein